MLRLCPVVLLVTLAVLCAKAADNSADARKAAAGDALFTNPIVREIRITIAPEAVKQLQRETREYVSATWREGQNILTNIGIHLKGTGSFRPIDQKPAFTVKFNKSVEGQNFYGLTKISLNNAVQDPSYVSEILCTELFRNIGVPAARVAHARVYLNDRYLGLYTLVEGLNKPFLRRNFSDTKGNLYEGHTKDVNEMLDQDNGENTSQLDLKALAEAAHAPAGERWEKLHAMVDLDRFISMLAGEVLMAHWDGYWLNRNNYCVYNNPSTRRMTFIPHGLDNMFQLTDMSWRPTMQGLVVRAVLHTPQGQRVYRERFSQLLTNSFRVEQLTNRVDEIAARIRPVLQADGPQIAKDWETDIAYLKRRISERMKNVSQQLGGLGVLAKFDAAGIAPVRGNWFTNVDAGVVIMTRGTEEKRPVLRVKHGDSGGMIASWRTRVALEGGRYRFRGKVKAEGLLPVGSPNVGVALRISGIHPQFQVVRDTDWRLVEFDFDVLPPSDDVELICELSTVLGEVWFDVSSLQLV
ncbi:MAG TPA: CotH kinase family protein, partial [Candidatus Binatia bacterium]|nr:CotH kinase family protein [Candidatus Binatia bacterium]